MSARKKWSTGYPRVTPGSLRRHESKVAVYRYVASERANWDCGVLRSPHLSVYVDEGVGWRLYEQIDLSEGDDVTTPADRGGAATPHPDSGAGHAGNGGREQ